MLPGSRYSFAEFCRIKTDSRYESVYYPSGLSHERQTALFKGCFGLHQDKRLSLSIMPYRRNSVPFRVVICTFHVEIYLIFFRNDMLKGTSQRNTKKRPSLSQWSQTSDSVKLKIKRFYSFRRASETAVSGF